MKIDNFTINIVNLQQNFQSFLMLAKDYLSLIKFILK